MRSVEREIVQAALRKRGYKTAREICIEDLFVNPSLIYQWKHRHPLTFPKSTEGLYRVADVKEWLVARQQWSNDSRMVSP